MNIRNILRLCWDHSNPSLSTDAEKCDYVVAKYLVALSIVPFMIHLSYELAYFINEFFPLSSRGISMFQTISVTLMAVGVWGQPGWKIQSWSGDTKAEQLNEKISKILSIFGFWFTYSSYHLVPTVT